MHFEICKDIQGQWRWRIVDSRSKIIATSSDGFQKRAEALRGLMLVRQQASNALIYDHSLNKWLGVLETSMEE